MGLRIVSKTKLTWLVLVFGLLSTARPCFGTINHVQQASNSDASGAGHTSFSATFGSATTSGNTIIFGVTFCGANPTITATDSQGNTYTEAIRTYDSGHSQGSAIFYSTNITGGQSTTVLVQFGDGVAYLALGIHEYSGIATVTPLDGTSGTLGNGTSLSSGGITTTANGDLIFSAAVEDSAGSGDTLTAGSGFVRRVDLADAAAYADEDQIQSLAGTISASWTLSPPGLDWIADVAAFKAASGPPSPTIASLSPGSGLAGTVVTITGTNFGTTQGSSTVKFNGTVATPTNWNATSIVAPVPSGTTSGNVVVTVSGAASNGVGFTVSAIRHVQQAATGDESGATYASFSATFGSATTTGNAIILGLAYGNVNPSITATDSQGNAYTEAIRTYDAGHNEGCAILYATNITGGTSNTVTVSFGNTVAYLSLAIHEYTGIAATSALDVVSGSTGGGADLSSGFATTTANGDLIFSCGVEDSNSGGDTFTPGTGFTKRVDLGTDTGYADEDRLQALAGATAATWTLSPDFLGWIDNMAAFKTSNGGGTSGPNITSLSPSSGPVGTSVTVAGVNFGATQGSSTVTFNGTTASPTSWSATGIAVPVPNGATTGNVVVTVSGVASNGVNFTVATNQPPVVSAGPDQTITYPTSTATLSGTVTDDGLPTGSTLQVSWSKVTGPGGVTFANSSQAGTQATFSLPGNYVLRLSANDGQYTTTSATTVSYASPIGGGIVVNAGPDQVVAYANAATLSGSATDTSPPAGSTLSVQWSKVSGPGTTTFSAPTALSGTVTFSVPGVYDLRLTATNGTFTASSDVKIYSGNVQCTLSNKGTDFWLMFTGALHQIPNPNPPQQLYLFISSDVATTVTVTAGPTSNYLFNQSYAVTPGQITTVPLPQSVQMTSSDAVDANGNAVEAKGIHVTAQNPVAVYGLNFYPFASDGYLGLPTSTLGTSYVIASYQNTIAGNGSATFGTEFGVTATQNNTTVTIVPTASSGSRQAQVPFTIQLGQGQTYQLRNYTDHTQLSSGFNPNGPAVDFTGTLVTSDKPVAVFGGHDCVDIPDGSLYCNSLVEQLPPTNLWGQNFVTMPLASERNGDTFRFVAQTDGTHVQVNHQEVAVLQKGQFFEQTVTGPAEISANNPILTVQYAKSAVAGGNSNTDPTMIVVPPFEQFGGSYTVNTPTANFPSNFINVIAPTAAAQASNVVFDGTPIPAASFQPIGTSPFSGAQIPVAVGPHTFTAGLPFGVWVYGFNFTDAYGYTGGVCFSTGIPGSTLVASPKSNTNQITSQVSIQATVKDFSGSPISGIGVNFGVAGVNSKAGYGTTNLSGVATFTYTGFTTGSDLITITAGPASDTAGVTWISNGPNQPPVVSAGPNRTISLPTNSVALNGSVVDDGLPIGGTLTSSWAKISGPGTVSFGTPNQPQTSATFSQAGTYSLQITGNDSALSASANVTVSVLPPNQPPVVNAGSNHSFMLIGSPLIQLTGTATDDGLPNPPSTLTVNWSTVSGPDLANFQTPTATTSYVTFNAPGTYVVRLSANDTQFTTNGFATVNAYGPVNVNAGSNLQTTVGAPITINGSVLVGGQAPTPSMPLTLSWSINSQPTGSHVTFGSPTSAVTTATFDTVGTYQLCLHANDANLQVGTANCSANISVAAANTPVPTVAITAPLDAAQLTAPTTVTGSVSSGAWTLDYALKDDFNPMTFTTLATGTGTISNAALGTFDPTLLLNGTYVIRLTSVSAAGQFATTSLAVSVAHNMKVGAFSVSFNDLTVPVAGIPIQVIRSYDSRDKGQGDFGVGWRLSLANIRVQKNRNLSLNWQETQTFSGQLPQYCLFATDNKVVTVTFPDGRVFTFRTGQAPQCQLAGNISTATLSFTELPGTSNTAGATLAPADGGQFLVDGSTPGAVSLIGFDGNPYNPTAFILQTADGTKYTIDQRLGLTGVTDANGNTLTITLNGITGPPGISVPFARDQQGRITRITDLNGKNLLYTYNSNGNLIGFTDRAANPNNYSYDSSHNLITITTADGKQVLTNTFDASGRLSATKDGNGFTVSFTHNLPGRTETVTDRNSNPTTYVYDADGNITQVTDALIHITTSTYDASDNKLSETNALVKTSTYTYDLNGNRLTETDPLQHTTTYTYNALSRPLTISDANNHTTTNTYDANGNLLTTTDPLGKTTTNTYTARGQLATTKDPLNNVTSFTYDSFGNLHTQTDARGTVTTYTYDANGNRASQAVTRTLPGGAQQTLTTTYVYDGNGRLTKTTYPDNSTTQTVYNSLGQQATTIDALGRQTTYQYDADGHVTHTTYPDNTTESTSYDHNGNRTVFTDRTNIVTTYTYDALNRLTQSQRGSNPSSATINKTSYDNIGQVLTTTDPDNNVTTYAYDDAGRRTQVTNALNQITTFVYDAAGNQTSFRDANNNTTTSTYDNANRRTQVTYPDTKFETTTYDALGRVTARTDANNKTTQYGYDTIGRLTSVTDALGQVTSYAYDEVGNRISQTDANNHTTTYAYDQRGRRVQRTLPLGQSESYTYDAAGNMLTRTDFNGRTTTYTYNAVNRLLSKTADPYFVQNHIGAASVSYTYNAQGQRSTMTDASGTTFYLAYDNNGHLTQAQGPSGIRLFYNYDAAGNLKQFGGTNNVNYSYDALNRMTSMSFSDRTGTFHTASYGYDNVGNLQTVTYPNGVVHNYSYNNRNRLTNLGVNGTVNGAPGAIASYTYTLDAAGHRTGVTELSGRTVSYGYDNLYRLTSETIASDPGGMNGAVSYTYDPVGNRTQKVSTLPGYPGGLSNYNANDRLSTDTYDNDGNTTVSNGVGYAYDFENHLVQAGAGISFVYDGDGNRVSKTVAGVTTQYLVDTQNPTGYPQVVYESFSGSTAPNREQSHTFSYGLELVNEARSYVVNGQSANSVTYFDYDGHGSVRALTDTTGTVTDTYDYDAFGNLIHSTGTTPNNYLFAGEQFDPDLNLYYNRARYLNVSTGRFWSMDTEEGDEQSPRSLHKYVFAGADPVNLVDPSGNEFDLTSFTTQLSANLTVYALAYPAVFRALSLVVNSLTPVELQVVNPSLEFETATGLNIILQQANQLGLIRAAFVRSGGFAKLGNGFQAFMANIARRAEGYLGEEVRILEGRVVAGSLEGSARIDFLFREFILEVKLTAQAALNNTNQLVQYAKYARAKGLPIRYILLQKPTTQEIEALQTIARKEWSGAALVIDYLFD